MVYCSWSLRQEADCRRRLGSETWDWEVVLVTAPLCEVVDSSLGRELRFDLCICRGESRSQGENGKRFRGRRMVVGAEGTRLGYPKARLGSRDSNSALERIGSSEAVVPVLFALEVD